MTQFRSTNPATGETFAEYPAATDADIDGALHAASRARRFADAPTQERAALLSRIAEALEARREPLALLATQEMGKTLDASRAEIDKCALACRHYADALDDYAAPRALGLKAKRSEAQTRALGPVLAVMPWNFPFWQAFRAIAPNLALGNPLILKHASNVPGCALAIGDVLREAGAPDGLFRTLLIGSDRVADMIADDRIAGVTLTGSEGAGRAVAKAAGEALKPCVLELGGSDAFIVCESADFDAALDAAVTARTMNNGQSCIAAKRFFVDASIHGQFRDAFAARLSSLKVGDPLQGDTDVGPLAMKGIRDDLDDQVSRSLGAGARRVAGADILDGPGWFYRPGLLVDAPEDAPVAIEEVFGPVASLWPFDTVEAAIARANSSRFGLGASLWTTDDADRAAAEGLEAGTVAINRIVASDPKAPFGGIKASGMGRELAVEGYRAFANIRTVVED